MSKKLGWLIALCVVVAGLWAYGRHSSPTYIFRYQLNVDVDTPDGVKSSSSIVEVSYARTWPLETIFGGGFGTSVLGEAVFIDLGDGRNLVLTLTDFYSASTNSESAAYLPVRIYHLPWGYTKARDEMRAAISRANLAPPRAVPFEMLPLAITFKGLHDPLTLVRVDPLDLAATYGSGYALKAVTIHATDAPITRELEHHLTWLPRLSLDKALDGGNLVGYDPFMISPQHLWKRY